MSQIPSIGRIVLFKNVDGVVYPGIILAVRDNEKGICDISVFKNNGIISSNYGIPYDETGAYIGAWSWPPVIDKSQTN